MGAVRRSARRALSGSALAALLAPLLLVCGALATAPARATDSPEKPRGTFVPVADNALDAYVHGRLAEADGALAASVGAYAQALALDPDSPEIGERGFRQAVLAGDKALALRAAQRLEADGALPRDGTVLLLVDALDHERWDKASALTDRIEGERNLAFLAPFLRSWISLHRGPFVAPVVPADQPYAAFAIRYRNEQALMMAFARKDRAGALEAFRLMADDGLALGAQERAIIAARLADMGERSTALSLMTGGPGGPKAAEAALKQAQGRYGRFAMTPGYGLSMLLCRLGMDLFGQGDPIPVFSILRIGGFAAPDNDDARVLVGRAALQAGYPAVADAETDKVAQASAAWFDAQRVQLRAQADRGQFPQAAQRAEKLVELDGGSVRAWRLLGDIWLGDQAYPQAAQAYRQARARLTERTGEKDDPALLLQLGGALEQAGNWEEARPILQQVVDLAPDSATALNHLGYAMADRGEDLPQAIALLEKANRIRPKVPAFVDSLGWAYFRAGRYDRAYPLIQSAVAGEPGNSELNEHLGDVLWAMGSHFEARYAWAAALIGIDDSKIGSGEMRARLQDKLKGGAPVPDEAAKTADAGKTRHGRRAAHR